MKKSFLIKKKKSFLLVCTLLLSTAIAFAQQRSITGIVLDESNEALIGATIAEKNTTNGTVADIDGRFTLRVTGQNPVLVVSYVGYAQKEVEVGDKAAITIVMKEDASLLDEVAVIGYGSARKRDFTGALTQVKSSQLEIETPASMQDFLKGNVPGLQVGFNAGPKPAGDLLIRGRNSMNAGTAPLIVLDGVIYPGDLADINPVDVEQFDILKDASSAAIYGARAANGVIIITTKRGKSEKPNIKFDMTLGVATIQKRQKVYNPNSFLSWRTDVMKSINADHQPYEFNDPRTLPSNISIDEWLAYDGSQGDPVVAWLNRLSFKQIEIDNYLAGNTVDWEDMVFQNAFRQDYNISLSGANNGLNYHWSLGYTDYEGLSKNNGFNAVRSRLNLDAKVNNFVTVGMNTHFSVRDESAIGADWGQYQKLTPYGTPYNEDGTYKLNPTDDRESKHPLIDSYYTDKNYKLNSLNANLYAKISLPFNISYQLNYSPRYEWVHDYVHKSSQHPDWANVGGSAYRSLRKDFLWQVDNIVKWKYTFNKVHDIDLTLLANAEKFQRWTERMDNELFDPSDVLGYHNIGAGANPIIGSDDEYRTGDALMARLYYSYNDRYMTTLALRRDGYSAFGQENPRALFPSTAFAWAFSEESFMNNIDWLNFGKLRVSWGVNGNRDIGVYQALARMTDNKYMYVRPDGTVENIAYIYLNSLANRELKWERTTATNIGLDVSVLNSRLTANIDVYKKNTKDLLISRSLPNIIGYSSVMTNLGEVQNKGIELSITSVNIKNDNFHWSTTFNYYLNRNKIVHLYGDMEDLLDNSGNVIGQKEADDIKNKWFIGRGIDEVWGQRVVGVWQTEEAEEAAKYGLRPGDFKVKDVNEDYQYTQDDNEFLGTTTPKYTWSLKNEFKIGKHLDVSFLMYSMWGHIGEFNIAKHNSGYQDRYNGYVLPYWTEDNPTNKWARLNSSNGSASFSVYRKKSFIRLDNISVGYTFPKKQIEKLNIQQLRVFGNIRNVAVWAPDWDFWDPENNGPVPRTFSVGLSFTL